MSSVTILATFHLSVNFKQSYPRILFGQSNSMKTFDYKFLTMFHFVLYYSSRKTNALAHER